MKISLKIPVIVTLLLVSAGAFLGYVSAEKSVDSRTAGLMYKREVTLTEDVRVVDIGTGHCTKNRAFRILKEELGDKTEQFRVGLVMEF